MEDSAKERILAAAEELFADSGFDATPTSRIAERAGVPKGLVHYYFNRKKDLLVTSGGKKVAPQPIEARLKKHPLVAEAVVIGDRRRFPAALIVPAFDVLAERLKALGLAGGDRDALVERPEVIGLYREVVDALNHDLAQFEQVKQIALLPTEFTIAGGELTPTLKVRRRVVETRWQDTIDRLYAQA